MAHIVYGIDYGQRFKKIFWTGLNQSGQFRIKKDLLLFYYFIIFIIPMMSSVSPVRLTVWSIAYQSVPVWSSLFRLCPVLFCSKLFRNEFGSVRFWSFFELISIIFEPSFTEFLRSKPEVRKNIKVNNSLWNGTVYVYEFIQTLSFKISNSIIS